MELKGSQTERNLLTAFAGESQARNRYTFYASQAKKEGLVQISSIFEETADQEKEHAKRLFKFLEVFKGNFAEHLRKAVVCHDFPDLLDLDVDPGIILFLS